MTTFNLWCFSEVILVVLLLGLLSKFEYFKFKEFLAITSFLLFSVSSKLISLLSDSICYSFYFLEILISYSCLLIALIYIILKNFDITICIFWRISRVPKVESLRTLIIDIKRLYMVCIIN